MQQKKIEQKDAYSEEISKFYKLIFNISISSQNK